MSTTAKTRQGKEKEESAQQPLYACIHAGVKNSAQDLLCDNAHDSRSIASCVDGRSKYILLFGVSLCTRRIVWYPFKRIPGGTECRPHRIEPPRQKHHTRKRRERDGARGEGLSCQDELIPPDAEDASMGRWTHKDSQGGAVRSQVSRSSWLQRGESPLVAEA